MAYTKIFAIRKRLDKTVNYAMNPDKTELEAMIQYAENPEKDSLVTAINCHTADAYDDMLQTKMRWGKTGGILGYHLIQSFAPGEISPQDAHAIGVKLAENLFGKGYEAVVGTHLDKTHLHNHIVVNSVNFQNGMKYHSNIGSYLGEIRKSSDELCKAHQLSVIDAKGHGKHYAEYQAERSGKPTIRNMIRMDIDRVIHDAYSFSSFLKLMEQCGYQINDNPKRKYITIRPPGGKRAIRLDSLGDGYTENEIRERIAENRYGGITPEETTKKRYRVKQHLPKKRKKIKGFQALYFRYVYLLKGTRIKSHKRYLSYEVRKEVIRLERYQKQFLYLLKENIETGQELKNRAAVLEDALNRLKGERDILYQKRKQAGEEKKEVYSETIDRYTELLREKRKEYRLLKQIEMDIPHVSRLLEITAETDNERKEEKAYEHQRRNR